MNPRPSPLPHLGKMSVRVTPLAFDLCVLYYRRPCTPYFPLSKNTGKVSDSVQLVSVQYTSWVVYSEYGRSLGRTTENMEYLQCSTRYYHVSVT